MCKENQNQDTDTSEHKENISEHKVILMHKETVLKFIMKLALVILIVWLIFTFVFGIRQVQGETMYPRLRDGDLILYYRLEQDYQIGDVVTFKMDDATFYGRIVAQGGDVVEVSEDGQLLVNGNIQQE